MKHHNNLFIIFALIFAKLLLPSLSQSKLGKRSKISFLGGKMFEYLIDIIILHHMGWHFRLVHVCCAQHTAAHGLSTMTSESGSEN